MTISWQPPTEYTDGTPLTDLAGYHIHYGTQSGNYSSTIQVADAQAATYAVQGLSPGTYYFAVSAYDSSGEESDDSQEVAVTVPATATGTDTGTGTGTSPTQAGIPPASTSATLGVSTNSPSAVVDAGEQDTLSGSPITVGSQSISVSSITVWINRAQAAPNNQFEVAIYTDNGGQPGSLVVASSSQTVVPQSWNTVPVSTTLSANTTYWLLYDTNSTDPSLNEMSLAPSTTSTGWYSGTPGSGPFGAWPSTASPGYAQNPRQAYSIYVTYQTTTGTLGNSTSTPPATIDSGDQNTMVGSPVTVGAQPVSASAIAVWINAAQAAPNNQFEVAIYTDNAGQPGSLVAASGVQTINPQSWNTVPLTATLSAGTKYWLLYNTNSTDPSLNELSLSASSTVNSWYSGIPGSAAFGTWPTTAPAGNFQSPAQAYSMYLMYK